MEKHSFDLWSPQLRNRRGVDVYLPDSYDARQNRYPVVYMQDGQNLSDPAIAYGGNTPHGDTRHGGGDGEVYVRFLTETVKSRIDSTYRTRRDRDSTIVAGSSMGGLISLYAFFRRPSPFGGVAAMSPSVWFGGRRILEFVEKARLTRGRIYVDVGTGEGTGTVRNTRALVRVLRKKGYTARSHSLRYVEETGHEHREGDWAHRLPVALEFLLRER
jgi:predicted alpha/beta superfamily hydrolase